MSNITVGPALEIGGNTVEMTTRGKVQVTNPKGQIKTLSQDEFKKNLVKNADKIEAGEDFEFKKDRKGLKIAAAAVATAAVVTAAIYHKEIGKYLKNFSFKKLWKDVKGLYNSIKNKILGKKNPVRTVFDKETANVPSTFDNDFAHTKNTLKYKQEGIVEYVTKLVKDFNKSLNATTGAVHANKQKMYERLFLAK